MTAPRAPRAVALAALTLLAAGSDLLGRPAAAQADPPQTPSEAADHDTTFRSDEIVIGQPSAPVTVVEYLSVTCTHCAAFERDTWPQARRELVDRGQVRFVMREMPTAPVAVSAAGFLLARCRGEASYWPTVEQLLQEQARILAAAGVEQALRVEASIAGLSETETRRCLSDPLSIDAVNARRQAGLASGVDSTPFFLINGAPLRPGVRLAGAAYLGGELTFQQLAAAVTRAKRQRAAAGSAAP